MLFMYTFWVSMVSCRALLTVVAGGNAQVEKGAQGCAAREAASGSGRKPRASEGGMDSVGVQTGLGPSFAGQTPPHLSPQAEDKNDSKTKMKGKNRPSKRHRKKQTNVIEEKRPEVQKRLREEVRQHHGFKSINLIGHTLTGLN